MGRPKLSQFFSAGNVVLKTLSPASSAAVSHCDVACPFCGLLCDDLTIRTDQLRVTPTANACPKALAAYAAADPVGQALIKGRPATLDQAMQHAIRLLKQSTRPLLAGLGTDVAGLRATFALAEKCHAMVDHLHSASLNLNLRVLQSRGWHTTTLSEVRNRADLIVLVGVDLNVNFQNFVPRCLAPADALQPARRAARHVVYLGPARQAPADHTGVPLEVFACPMPALTSTVRVLQGMLSGQHLSLARGKRHAALVVLAERIKAAEYAVFVWAPGQLPAHGDLTISAVCELVADINRTRRAAGLALGGDDGAQSALAVSSWLTGFPSGVSFTGGQLQYSAGALTTSRILADKLADLVVFITSFSRREPPLTMLPTIVLSPPGWANAASSTRAEAKAELRAEVYLPVGIPGIDHAGQLVRTDGEVTLPLKSLRDSGLPSVAQLLARLREGLK